MLKEKSIRGCSVLIAGVVSGLLAGLPTDVTAGEEVVQEWVATYMPSFPDSEYWPPINDVAVDRQGNVYGAGHVGFFPIKDVITLKHDSDGNLLWVARYNGPADGLDWGVALTLDANGNAYVTGYSEGNGTGEDFVTIKYDKHGREKWVARYNGPGNARDRAAALVLDSSNNVYVTGRSSGGSSGDDYATVKYDKRGKQLWVARYNGPANFVDRSFAIVLDEDEDDLYVTGGSVGNVGFVDYATIKYDTDGQEIWVARYDGPGQGFDVAADVAIARRGDVIVTGTSEGVGTSSDYATIRYDNKNGQELWVARYDGPEHFSDNPRELAVDANDNVYVVGDSERDHDLPNNPIRGDLLTVKYDKNGSYQWEVRYNGTGDNHDNSQGLVLDRKGDVYVTASPWNDVGTHDFYTAKYDRDDGSLLWEQLYDGTPDTWNDVYASPEVDDDGNVYVGGYGQVATDPWTPQWLQIIKYSQPGFANDDR